MICRDRERRECGSADVEVWQSSDLLDPIKPKGVGVVWLNNSLVIYQLPLHLPCLLLTTVFLNARWDTESPVKMPASICIPAMGNITCQTNR